MVDAVDSTGDILVTNFAISTVKFDQQAGLINQHKQVLGLFVEMQGRYIAYAQAAHCEIRRSGLLEQLVL